MARHKAAPAALYVHFPFCLSICPYCDFVVYAGRDARGPSTRMDLLVEALVAEIGLRSRPGSSVGSVYIGGGTPSLMSAAQVGRILEAAEHSFGIAADAEITLEVNPGSGERGDLSDFRATGVNRLSVGAQSFSDAELRRLGRRHSAADVTDTVRLARRSGFESVSLDLLYDIPQQMVYSWRQSLERAVALELDHLSAYALSLDDADAERLTGALGDHLPLRTGARKWRSRARQEQSEDRAASLYVMTEEVLTAAGFEWYELSNWARPGKESRHNLCYWEGRPWEAVGPGAHAFDGVGTRRWNAARLDAYLAALLPSDRSSAQLPPGTSITTDAATAVAEYAMLRLRTRGGLSPKLAGQFKEALAWARANDLVDAEPDGGIRLTLRGRLVANELFMRMLPDESAAAA